MNRPLCASSSALLSATIAAIGLLAGCANPDTTKIARPPVERLEKRPVPPFMTDTIYQITNLQNDQPFLVSGWGLVVNLEGTGGSKQVPNNVKAYMIKEMEKKGFGSKLRPEYENISPEVILNDKNAAVVAVYGYLPPGARKGQWFDVGVRAEGLEVSSLARGLLYDADLTIEGADPVHPGNKVNIWGLAYGPVFVNPGAAMKSTENADKATQQSLRTGTIMWGGQVTNDRPLILRIRMPENRLARAIESRVNDVFHTDKVCTAYDSAYCQLWVPPQYNGDWEHFSKLVQHIYLTGGSEAIARRKARELVAEARKPGAPLQDISYCWEGLGSAVMPDLAPLLNDAAAPEDVRFAAARAAAYIGDPTGAAERALYDIARSQRSAFQVPAVQVLGHIPNSRAVNQLLRDLLDSDETTVRIEAYNILAKAGDPAVQSREVASSRQSNSPKFVLDLVQSHGQPLIYATRSGVPRVAIFGDIPELTIPVTFGALGNRLTISSGAIGRDVTIFYRSAQLQRPVQMSSPPDIADLVSRLAGQMDDGTGQLDFTYAEIVAILQSMSDQQKLQVVTPTGEPVAVAFMLQVAPEVRDAIDSAPLLDRTRPQGETSAPRLDAPRIDASPAGLPPVSVGDASTPSAMLGKQ
jgi:flagellar basal body P-ring protein FlgI